VGPPLGFWFTPLMSALRKVKRLMSRIVSLAVGAVVNPIARGRDPLTGRNGGGVPNYGHHVPMPAHLGAQNAEAVLGIVVGDALDEARQNFLG
jgi:hypothetical protein